MMHTSGLMLALTTLFLDVDPVSASVAYYQDVGLYQTVSCNGSECIVNCTASNGCRQSTIIANDTATTSLTIYCAESMSCAQSVIYADAIQSLHIMCVAQQSCYDLTVYADTAHNITLSCDFAEITSSYHSSCEQVTLHANHSYSTFVHCTNYNCDSSTFYLTNATIASFVSEGSYALYLTHIYAQDLTQTLTIDCDGYNACSSIQIVANHMAGDLAISCTGERSCSYSGIHADTSTMSGNVRVWAAGFQSTSQFQLRANEVIGSVDVYCMSNYSCDGIDIHCTAEQNCNVVCGPFESACAGADLYLEAPFYEYIDAFNLTCLDESKENACSLESSCWDGLDGTWGGSSTFVYENSTQSWRCIGSGYADGYGCCPFPNGVIHCSPDEPCVVMCLDYTECQGFLINATDASSLEMQCAGWDSCEGAIIFGPQQDNASFSLQCLGAGSCFYARVYILGATNMHDVSLLCADDTGCKEMKLVLNASTISLLNIHCIGCTYLELSSSAQIDALNLHCTDDSACGQMFLALANTVRSASLLCNGTRSCERAHFEIQMGNSNHSLQCLGYKACGDTNFDLHFAEQNVSLNIVCFAEYPEYSACDGAHFHIGEVAVHASRSSASSVSLYCNIDGADGWHKYNCARMEFTAYNIGSVNVFCDGYHQTCFESVFTVDSASKFNLHCDGTESCAAATVLCPFYDAAVCQIDCNGGQSCDSMNIVVDDLYVEDYLNMSCKARVENGSVVDAYQTCHGVWFECTSFSTVAYVWNNATLQYECENQGTGFCCPEYAGGSLSLNPITTTEATSASTTSVSDVSTTIDETQTSQTHETTNGAVVATSPELSTTQTSLTSSPEISTTRTTLSPGLSTSDIESTRTFNATETVTSSQAEGNSANSFDILMALLTCLIVACLA